MDLKKPLILNQSKLGKYSSIVQKNIKDIPPEYRVAHELAVVALTSKQCNEPYEILLSDVLDVMDVKQKHGWDALDNLENPTEFYEYKPSSNATNPSGTINDDTLVKIEKCEKIYQEGKKGWLVLAGIDKTNYSFNCVYKFPLEIYNEDRRSYLSALMEKNKVQTKQTRSTYSITIKKSINLCTKFGKEYYVWQGERSSPLPPPYVSL